MQTGPETATDDLELHWFDIGANPVFQTAIQPLGLNGAEVLDEIRGRVRVKGDLYILGGLADGFSG